MAVRRSAVKALDVTPGALTSLGITLSCEVFGYTRRGDFGCRARSETYELLDGAFELCIRQSSSHTWTGSANPFSCRGPSAMNR